MWCSERTATIPSNGPSETSRSSSSSRLKMSPGGAIGSIATSSKPATASAEASSPVWPQPTSSTRAGGGGKLCGRSPVLR